MEIEIIKAAGQVAGLGGLALGVFLILFREIIRKNIFPQLTKSQAFRFLNIIALLVWSIALAGIGAWIWVETQPKKDQGNLEISQVIYGTTDDERRFMSVVLNNTSNKKHIIQKLVYSRGRSSVQDFQNMMCCPYCGGSARYFVDKFKTSATKSRTSLLFFREKSAHDEVYVGRIAYSPGCTYPTFAQIELPMAVSVERNNTFDIRVYLSSSLSDSNEELPTTKPKFALKEILAEPDQVCTYIYTDHAGRLEQCVPESGLVEEGLFL